LEQRAIHREVLVVQQSRCLGLRPYLLEELLRDLAPQQPVAVLVNTVTSHTGVSIFRPTNQR
jgi:hypothetical protein